MAIWELLLIGVGLSMDAFAVAVCKGLSMRAMRYKKAFMTGGFFGVFQAMMPILGFLLGTQFKAYITPVDHWIAFALLAFIGGKMIYESKNGCGESEACGADENAFGMKTLLLAAFATSIDALAVGVTFAFLDVSILPASLLIGCITFALSVLGVKLGQAFRGQLRINAGIVGGIVLVLMGLKIVLEHLNVLVI